MLTMRSASASPTLDDRTAMARIRDAALVRFSHEGFRGATIRAIAADAGVSPALVLHHFGSKDGLRTACDEHVVRLLMSQLEPWIADPASLTAHPASFAAMIEGAGDIVDYVRRTLVEGGEHTDALVDQFVDLTETFLAEGETQGSMRPIHDRRAMAAVLVMWDLTTIVLRDHLTRSLGETDPKRVTLRYARVALELFSQGMLIDPKEAT